MDNNHSPSSNPYPRPSRLMLFAWQAPLMTLSYAITCFLADMAAVVISPLTTDLRWGDDAKVKSSLYLIIREPPLPPPKGDSQ